jgi:hypothetical protein
MSFFAKNTALAFVFLACARHPADAASWPTIQPFDQSFTFKSPQEMYLRLPIKDVMGKDAYIVECASPLASDERVRGFPYSHDFECRVALPDAKSLPDTQLLALDANIVKEWQSRGGFWWSELMPACQDYPFWGTTRVFRLRHMRITITLSDIDMVPAVKKTDADPYYRLRGLKVSLHGEVDNKANRVFGGYTRYAEPYLMNENEPRGYLNCNLKQKIE